MVAGGEIELADAVTKNRPNFQFVVSNSLVLRENNPTLTANEGEPVGICRAGSKVAAMPLMWHVVKRQSIQDRPAVMKVFVEVEDETFRQRSQPFSAPTGLLLRFVAA